MEEARGSEAILEAPSTASLFRGPSLPSVFLRLCLYLALDEGISYALQWVARLILPSGPYSSLPNRMMLGESIDLMSAFFAALLMSRFEGRAFGEYGLPGRAAFGKMFWLGASFGLVEISTVLGTVAALGGYRFGELAIHGSDLWRWAIFWGAFFLVVGFYEEFAFRGYGQFTMGQGVGFWPTAIVLSIIFGVMHSTNQGESWLGIAGVVVSGLFWCLTLRRTGSLWFAVGMHASFDFAETFLYSVPDSGMIFPGHLSNATLRGPVWLTGGTAGPEASVLDFLVLAVFFYVFHRLFPAKATTNQAADKA
ncbi:MAG TPA: CPBP family intramembrane glutamic endopeptidase [Candidatus Acidoferrum sp.]|nr:CPBP family intramembrane glutamic endopeptidase [Candidatus Acidoferrum sp.]